jgi:hypothetical protein
VVVVAQWGSVDIIVAVATAYIKGDVHSRILYRKMSSVDHKAIETPSNKRGVSVVADIVTLAVEALAALRIVRISMVMVIVVFTSVGAALVNFALLKSN